MLLRSFSISGKNVSVDWWKPSFPDADMTPTLASDTIFPGSYQEYYSSKSKISLFRAPFALFPFPENPGKRPDRAMSRKSDI